MENTFVPWILLSGYKKNTSTYHHIEGSIYFDPLQNSEISCNDVWYANDNSTFLDLDDSTYFHSVQNSKACSNGILTQPFLTLKTVHIFSQCKIVKHLAMVF